MIEFPVRSLAAGGVATTDGRLLGNMLFVHGHAFQIGERRFIVTEGGAYQHAYVMELRRISFPPAGPIEWNPPEPMVAEVLRPARWVGIPGQESDLPIGVQICTAARTLPRGWEWADPQDDRIENGPGGFV